MITNCGLRRGTYQKNTSCIQAATILLFLKRYQFHLTGTVVLMRDHIKSPQKQSLKGGLPYLVGNQGTDAFGISS